MTAKRSALVLVGLCALGCSALAPTRVGDGRLPRWINIIWDIRQGAMRVATFSRGLVATLHAPGAPPLVEPSRTAAQSSADQPILGTLTAVQTASVLDKAYAAAVATERLKTLGYDTTGVREALSAYHAGDLAGGDAAARTARDPVVRAALEWVALREVPVKIGLDRVSAFASSHPDWPTQTWSRHQIEARLIHLPDTAKVEAFFVKTPPLTSMGKLALAHALKADGHGEEAARIARALYREADLSYALEGKIRAEFGSDLQKSDYKYRADRLLYKEDVGTALRVAALAGPDEVALAKARAAVIAEAASDKALAAVPPALRNDPGLLLAQIQKLRRADKIKEAATAMLAAPRDPALLIAPDEWWTERRVLARKVLDTGDAQTAYKICAGHSAASPEARIEAEFHSGWIALRFLNDPTTAMKHFEAAGRLAETPTSISRIAYWEGRATENSPAPDALTRAQPFYAKAAHYPSTYHGQLARKILGPAAGLSVPAAVEAKGSDRSEAVRVVEFLYGAGEKDAGSALALEAAQNLKDEEQINALAAIIEHQQDAHLALTLGKVMSQRGFATDQLAFPTFGIPSFEPLLNSASTSVVYSVARQESAFNPTVVSSAGAKGLMQMIDSTAKRTAIKAGLAFDEARMLTDAAFNARLGAAHLGALLAEQGGSYILTFAAYNAGGGRVKQWIESYGDPRDPSVDPVDWVERIPFTETRNYVQRVIANVTIYEARFAEAAAKVDKARANLVAQAKL